MLDTLLNVLLWLMLALLCFVLFCFATMLHQGWGHC